MGWIFGGIKGKLVLYCSKLNFRIAPIEEPHPYIEIFLRKRLGSLYDWTATEVVEPIGPQTPDAFNSFSLDVSGLKIVCQDFLMGDGKDIISPDHFTRTAAEPLFDKQFKDFIEKLISETPPTYASGFGAISDKDAYSLWGAMSHWTTSEAFAISLGLTPTLLNEAKPIDKRFPKQAEFAFNRGELIRRQWHDKSEITPEEFCRWAKSRKIECPNLMYEAVAYHHETDGSESVQKKPDLRAEKTLYKIIYSLVRKHYKYDPSEERSGTPKKLESLLDQEGLSVSAQTIRKHLKDAFDAVSRVDID